MRLAAMIPKLTPPRMIRGTVLPTFNQICRPSSSETRSDEDQDEEESVSFSSISDEIKLPQLFGPKEDDVPRVIFFGEQHHQARVLSSQLQIINQLFQVCKEPKKIHIVLEHWSLADQPFLNDLNSQNGNDFDPRSSDTEDSTSEGFSMSHYLTIVKLVRELGGTVWGGFPPRSWAKMISKSQNCVFGQVQQLDQQRYSNHDGSLLTQQEHLIPPLPVNSYEYVENISWPHRIYLKNMFRPDKRPEIPSEITNIPPKEKQGFLAAQALKDTFGHIQWLVF